MNKPLKLFFAVVAGLIVWSVLNFGSMYWLAAIWPALGEVGGYAFETGDFSRFSVPMLILLLAMWTWVNVGAGWTTVFITKHRNDVWILVVLLSIFALYNHAYVYWNNLPNWYNIVLIIIFPITTYVGGLLVKKAE